MDLKLPEEKWEVDYIKLHSDDNKLVFLPPGYANGFKALEKGSIIIGFSASGEIEENKILRWDADKWLDWHNV